jgi:hypothetical protein
MKQAQIRWGKRDGPRISYLAEHYPHMTLRELTFAFNSAFDLSVSEAAVGYQLHVHRILKKDVVA